jgi:hypothetical protein
MQRRTLSMLAGLIAALPLATQADTMDYSFVELGYVDAEIDDPNVDGDGFALRGSLAFNPNFFGYAEMEDIGYDRNVDVTTLQVGVGGRYPLGQKLDLVGRVGLVRMDVDTPIGEDDEDGFTLGARLRGEVAQRFELEGGFDYIDVDSGDDTSIVLEGRYFFVPNVSGGLRLEFGDRDAIGLAARLTF